MKAKKLNTTFNNSDSEIIVNLKNPVDDAKLIVHDEPFCQQVKKARLNNNLTDPDSITKYGCTIFFIITMTSLFLTILIVSSL